jgi:hypothetical protein
MKKLITLLLVLVTLNVHSQYVLNVDDINIDSIEYYMFEMVNEHRDSIGKNKWYRSLTCKKAGEHFLDYIKEYNQTLKESGHTQLYPVNGIKTLSRPIDRYNYFYDEGTITYCEGLKTKTKFEFYGEIITRDYVKFGEHWASRKWVGSDTSFKVISNKDIARNLLNNFMKSKGHYGILASTIRYQNNNLYRGYFKVMITPSNNERVNIYAIGVFDCSWLCNTFKNEFVEYSGDTKKIY